MDIFDNVILCKKCGKKMSPIELTKNSFILRAVQCEQCGGRVLHPLDEQEYKRFLGLRHKEYRVKMRLVGNSYAVSIPREIVSFMEHQENMMNEMVRLCFEDFGKVSLNFGEVENA